MKYETHAPDRTGLATTAALIVLITFAPAVAEPAPHSAKFATELDAVIAATRQYNLQSSREDREFMGAILRHGNNYSFTVGAGEPSRDRITVSITVPAGARIVAFWHTHGARRYSNRYFSNVDTALVETWQKRLYLADHTGLLKVMVPGAPTLSRIRARRLGLPSQAGFARGAIVSDSRGEPVRIATRL